VLSAEDDGAGFVPPERPGDLALQGHFGLVGMYERATRLGGHLSIRSTPGEGARVVAFLPYSPTSLEA
jgi:signal transduction histidine kinase